jgi:hypothetical protein
MIPDLSQDWPKFLLKLIGVRRQWTSNLSLDLLPLGNEV